MLLPLLLCLTFTVAIGMMSEKPTPCILTTEARKQPSFYNLNEKALKAALFEMKVSQESPDKCFVNLTEIVPNMALPTFPIFQVIGIVCKSHKSVYFTEYTGARAKHVIFHVQVKLCVLEINNINNLLSIGDTRVLLVNGLITREENNDTAQNGQQNDPLKSLVSFALENNVKKIQNITTVFNLTSSYPNLAEISLKNITLDIFHVQMIKSFPNLQSLELPDNNLMLPPEMFPWGQDRAILPRNLSRSRLVQNHYINSDYIDIPSNVFRRYLNLDGNIIRNLSDYVFHGKIDKVSLKRNELQTIGESTFRNITGLQHLDLSNNLLTEIPNRTFKGMMSLKKLDLGENKIPSLPHDIFSELVSLRVLSLANNSLESVPTGLFETLKDLEILRLERNKLININPDSFPLASVKLKEIHLQFNPLTDLPHFPFYIRTLELANFHATSIAFRNFTSFLEKIVDFQVYRTVVDSASNPDRSDVLERAEVLRKIDLSDCNITSIQLTEQPTEEIAKLLKVLLLHFQFVLTNNPIYCDCDINPLIYFILENVKNGTFANNEYFFNDWLCHSPTELYGRKMLTVKQEETYCEISVPRCPKECICYERATVKHIIVDCRSRKLNNIHRNLPDGKLELWYSDNNITFINSFQAPEKIIVLDVSTNKIEAINGEVVERMNSLQTLRLNANVLAYIPQEISMLNLQNVRIFPNPFTCDCKTLWMKTWLENNKHVVKDWNKVSCKIENEDGMVMTDVPDDKFVCNKDFDDFTRVVLPSVICSVLTLLLMILSVIVYAYRLECKVLMFVYLGIHPFDKDSNENKESLDCVVVHSGLQTDWVMEKIVSLLENEHYEFVVCDMVRDFVIGYSFQENLTKTVRHSKRMIFCLSEDWKMSSESFTTTWRIAQEKIKNTRSHYGIIVSHEIKKHDVEDKHLRRFMNCGRFVDSKDRLFGNKIVYYMPQTTKIKPKFPENVHFKNINCCGDDGPDRAMQRSKIFENQQLDEGNEENAQSHAFISYHDNDFQFVIRELLPLLDKKGFSYCLADRDFVPGASIEENILNAINKSHRTILILSTSHVEDEWTLFIFRAAYEKALREKSNHLLVIIKDDDVEKNNLDEEIRHYLKNYIHLNVKDRWFEQKLYNGLPLLKNQLDLHTSPLFLRCRSVDENDVVIEVN